jgi:uncharacterized protein involved in exopolysaccharide biosynthesis
MAEEFSLISVIRFLLKKIRWILILSFLVALVTAGITLLLPNYYETSTAFYAASPDLSSPTPLSVSQQKINVYGNDEDLDRLLSIAHSNQLSQFLIDSFNLYQHYDIDPAEEKSSYKVRKRLDKHMEVLKTKFGAIDLSIEDLDPIKAADMANASRNKISSIAQELIKDSQKKTIANYSENIEDKHQALKILIDSISVLRDRYGIIDVESQGEVLATSSANSSFSLSEAQARLKAMEEMSMPGDSINRVKARVAGLRNKKANISRQLEQFNKGITRIKSLDNQLVLNNDQIGLMKERLSQLKAAYENPFTSLHVVEEAMVPVIKSRPKRSLIVIGATILTFIFVSMSLLLMDSLSKINWK